MTSPSATVLRDSLNQNGNRLTTFEVTCHRFVLAEFNTHRNFSRNSASSRAIPVKKQINRVLDDPALPLAWPDEQPGMSGGEEVPDAERETYIRAWLKARDEAVKAVTSMTNAFRKPENELKHPLHKSVANRLLEPFMWHTIVVSSTEWENFFELRCSPAAQPEIRMAAEAIREAYNASEPALLLPGDWHLPYLDDPEEIEEIRRDVCWDPERKRWDDNKHLDAQKRVSTARCCRVSYLNQGGGQPWLKDFELADRLEESGHWSPFEHVATPILFGDAPGNFFGFRQFRHELDRRELPEYH